MKNTIFAEVVFSHEIYGQKFENYKSIVQILNVRLWHFTAKNIILTRFISLLIYWSPQLWGHVHIFTYFGQKPWFFCYVENTIFTKSLFWTCDSVRAGPLKLAVFLENGSKDFLDFLHESSFHKSSKFTCEFFKKKLEPPKFYEYVHFLVVFRPFIKTTLMILLKSSDMPFPHTKFR